MDRGLTSKTEAELQIMDLENNKQRLLLEVSKLTSMLKGINCWFFNASINRSKYLF